MFYSFIIFLSFSAGVLVHNALINRQIKKLRSRLLEEMLENYKLEKTNAKYVNLLVEVVKDFDRLTTISKLNSGE